MSLEAIVTDVKVESHKDRVAVTLWKYGTIHLPYTHTFPSKYLDEDQKNEILQKLEENPSTKNPKTHINTGIMKSPKKEGKQNIFLYGPPSITKTFDSKLNKTFFQGNYTMFARENIVKPGEVITIDKDLADTLSNIRRYNQKIKGIKTAIRDHAGEQNKSTITRRFNELDDTVANNESESIDDKLFKRVGEDAVSKRKAEESRYQQTKSETERKTYYEVSREDRKAIVTAPNKNFIKNRREIAGKELYELPWVDLDIEIPLFKDPENAMISWVGAIYHEKDDEKDDVRKALYTLADVGDDTWNGYKIQKFENQSSLLEKLAEDIREYDPLTLSAYNNKYDFINLNKEGTFEIGIYKNKPVYDANTKFFERIATKGRLLVDKLRWAQIAYPYLPNKKLNLIGKEVLGKGAFDKSITYKQMERLERIALYDKEENKRKKKTRIIATYVTEDVDVLYDIHENPKFRWSLDMTSLIAHQNRLPIEHALYSPRETLKRQDINQFNKNKIHPNEFNKIKNIREEKKQAKQYFRKFLKENNNIQWKNGIYNNVKLIQLNHAKALREELHHIYPQGEGLFSGLEKYGNDSFKRTYLTNILNNSCNNIIADMMVIEQLEQKIDKQFEEMELPSELRKIYWKQLNEKGEKYLKASGKKEATEQASKFTSIPTNEEKIEKLLKNMNRYRKRKKRYYAAYKNNFETSRHNISHQQEQTENILESYGLTPIYQEGQFLYVQGDSTTFKEHYPGRIITAFDTVYLSEDFEEKNRDIKALSRNNKKRLYYRRHGFYKGITIKDEPTHNLTLFEMETYKGFLENIFSGEYQEAFRHLAKQERNMYCDLENNIDNDKLIMMTQRKEEYGRDRYKAFENGNSIYFYTSEDENRHPYVDPETGIRFEKETIHNKERPVYIMNPEDFRPDWNIYYARNSNIIYNLAFHTIGKEKTLNLLENARKGTLFLETSVQKAAEELERKTFY